MSSQHLSCPSCWCEASLSQTLFEFLVRVTEYREKQEMQRNLQVHEEMIKENKSTIFTISVKVKDNEQQVISYVVSIMGILVQVKQ
jgi:hypothetical protein